MKNNNSKINSILRELSTGFYIEGGLYTASPIAMTILDEDTKVKPDKFGDCSLCKKNCCDSCKYYTK